MGDFNRMYRDLQAGRLDLSTLSASDRQEFAHFLDERVQSYRSAASDINAAAGDLDAGGVHSALAAATGYLQILRGEFGMIAGGAKMAGREELAQAIDGGLKIGDVIGGGINAVTGGNDSQHSAEKAVKSGIKLTGEIHDAADASARGLGAGLENTYGFPGRIHGVDIDDADDLFEGTPSKAGKYAGIVADTASAINNAARGDHAAAAKDLASAGAGGLESMGGKVGVVGRVAGGAVDAKDGWDDIKEGAMRTDSAFSTYQENRARADRVQDDMHERAAELSTKADEARNLRQQVSAYGKENHFAEDVQRAALLSGHSYRSNPSASVPPGYEILDEKLKTDSGLEAVAYRHLKTGEITIAFRGTEFEKSNDRLADLGIGVESYPVVSSIASGNPLLRPFLNQGRVTLRDQLSDANAFTDEITRLANEKFPGAPIRFTGHSLGGAIAQYEAARTGLDAHTFNAPGMAGIIEQDFGDKAPGDVYNHVRAGDLVHQATGDYYGKTLTYDDPEQTGPPPKWNEVIGDEAANHLERHNMDMLSADLYGGLTPREQWPADAEAEHPTGDESAGASAADFASAAASHAESAASAAQHASEAAQHATAHEGEARRHADQSAVHEATTLEHVQQSGAHATEANDHSEGSSSHTTEAQTRAEHGASLATEAQGHAQQAGTHEQEAQGHAQQTGTHATEAQEHGRQSESHTTEAQGHAQQGATHATEAQTHASNASSSAEAAGSHSQGAGTHESESQTHAQQASSHAGEAQTHAQQTGTHETEAQSHATQAATHVEAAESHARETTSHGEAARTHAEHAGTQADEAGQHTETASQHEATAAQHVEGASTHASSATAHAESAQGSVLQAGESARDAAASTDAASQASASAQKHVQEAANRASAARQHEQEARTSANQAQQGETEAQQHAHAASQGEIDAQRSVQLAGTSARRGQEAARAADGSSRAAGDAERLASQETRHVEEASGKARELAGDIRHAEADAEDGVATMKDIEGEASTIRGSLQSIAQESESHAREASRMEETAASAAAETTRLKDESNALHEEIGRLHSEAAQWEQTIADLERRAESTAEEARKAHEKAESAKAEAVRSQQSAEREAQQASAAASRAAQSAGGMSLPDLQIFAGESPDAREARGDAWLKNNSD